MKMRLLCWLGRFPSYKIPNPLFADSPKQPAFLCVSIFLFLTD